MINKKPFAHLPLICLSIVTVCGWGCEGEETEDPDLLYEFADLAQEEVEVNTPLVLNSSITNEEAYLLGKFARVALRTKYIDYNGRLCMSAAASGASQTFGMDRGFTNSLSEVPFTRCLILVGTNIAECQPTIMPYFEKAKENGAYIIVVDPRETATAKIADLHLKIKPGTDTARPVGKRTALLFAPPKKRGIRHYTGFYYPRFQKY